MERANVVETTDATFDQDVLNAGVPVLVDFWADWCPPCKAIAPALATLADENTGRFKVVKIDIAANRATASKFSVTHLPLFLVFSAGKLVGKQVGTGGGTLRLKLLLEPHVRSRS